MFELPNAKRVKRSDVFSASSSSDEEEPDAIERVGLKGHKFINDKDGSAFDDLKVDYGFEYELINRSSAPAFEQQRDIASKNASGNENDPDIKNADEQPTEAEAEAETYAFNLFAPKPAQASSATRGSTTSATTQTQITLRPPTPPQHSLTLDHSTAGGRMLHPRPLTHYFTSSLPPSTLTALESQYAASAVAGTAVLSQATTPWPGTSQPWRIIHVRRTRLTLRTVPEPPVNKRGHGDEKSRARPRPSKKRRIQVRQRRQARETARLAGAVAEQAEREKRTRRNREKKVKRKLREKAKKVAGRAEVEGDRDGDVNGDGDVSTGDE